MTPARSWLNSTKSTEIALPGMILGGVFFTRNGDYSWKIPGFWVIC